MMTHPATNDRRPPAKTRAADLAAAVASLTEADGQLRQQAPAHPAAQPAMDWEGRYRALVDFLPDACFITDAAGVIREANRAASSLIGFARKYALGKPLAAYFTEDNAPRVRNALTQVAGLADGKALTWEGRVKPRRRDSVLHVQVRAGVIRDGDGALVGYQWLVRDISAEYALAEQNRSLVAEQDARLRVRTAELEAVVKVQSALIEQHQADASS